jgi:hypothetical protein
MRHFLCGSLLLLSGFLTACSTMPRTTSEVWPLYRPEDFARAGGGRDTYVVLRGNPLAMQPSQFEQLVLNNMQGQNWGPRTNFTTRPTNYDNAYKVVLLFNGANVNGGELCSNPGAVPVRTGPQSELHVVGAYCRYDQMMTLAQGWLNPEGSGVSQEGFARLTRAVTAELFPPFNPDDARKDSRSNDDGSTIP